MNQIRIIMNPLNRYLVCLFSCMLIFCFTASAQYTLQNSDVVVENSVITSCNTTAANWGTGELIIPKILNGQIIKSIGFMAFSKKGISKLILPEGIEKIKAWAFSSNPIVDISFPQSLVKIEGGAFEHCSLTSITLPNNLEYIGSSTFGYNSIDSVKIPQSVTFLGGSIFQQNSIKYVEFEENSNIRLIDEWCFYDGGYSSLKSFILPLNSNPGFKGYKDLQGKTYKTGDTITNFKGTYFADLPPHVLTSEDVEFKDNLIIDYSGSYANIIVPNKIGGIAVNTIPASSFDYRMLVEVKIEEGITLIDDLAFANCHIKKLSLPNTLTEIRSAAFSYNSIDTLLMPDNINSVAGFAFSDNTLKYVKLSKKLSYIEANVFEHNLLDSISIPENITSIGEYAFNSNSLVKLQVPESVQSIGKSAFANNLLTELFMHNNITSAGDFAFANNNIDTITFSNKLTEISMGLFENNAIDSVIIPENIQSIGDSAFSGNFLRNINIPNHLNYIGEKAFADNKELLTIQLPAVFKDGFTFNNWQNNSDSSIVTSIVDLNVSYKALFTINTYNVTFTSDENGKLEGNTVQTVKYGTDATIIIARANAGYHFLEWQHKITGDSVTNKNPLTLQNIVSDTALVAVFAKDIINPVFEKDNLKLRMYPNPAIGFFEIKSPVELNSIEIININGLRMYYNDKVKNTNLRIDLKNLSSGVYSIIVKGKDIYKVTKIIVK